ncbi:MAG: hypothetical protein ABI587_01005 [Gemmatimonadales bacterium]
MPWPVWRQLPAPVRAIGRWLTLVQVTGYSISLFYVWHTTRMRPGGIADHYRGSEGLDGAMQFPKSLGELLTITHTHLLSMVVIFVLSGVCLSLCERVPERIKRVLVTEPFLALLVSISAIWLTRYVHPGFGLLLELSSLLMAGTFYLQSWLVLAELGLWERQATG